ncbi:4260_t:CDS:2, partial [Scutellospora calospora]
LEHQTNRLPEIETEELEHHLNNSFEIEESEQQTENSFINFLEEIKEDYKKRDLQLCVVLDKFSARYKAAKSQSIPHLTTFLHNINHNSDPLARIKGSRKISVQVESIKRKKTGSTSIKQKYSKITKINDENDPHNIPKCKRCNNIKYTKKRYITNISFAEYSQNSLKAKEKSELSSATRIVLRKKILYLIKKVSRSQIG